MRTLPRPSTLRRGRTLATRASFNLIVEILTMALSMSTFVVLGRSLGPTDYGRYAATISMFTVISPFAAGGSGQLLTRRVALGEKPATAWPKAAGVVHLLGLASVAAAIVLATFLLPGVPLVVVMGLALAELALFRLAPNAVLMTNGLDRPDIGALVMALTVATRLAALATFFVLGSPGLGTWVVLHIGSGLVACLVIHALTARLFGVDRFLSRPTVGEYREQLPFALTLAPNTVLNDADKTLLTTLGRSYEGGLYAAGYRIASLAYMPIMAVIRSTFAQFYRTGAKGMEPVTRAARRLTMVTVGIGAVSGVGLLVLAPLLPYVLGDDFRDSVAIVQVMAGLPLLKAVEYPAANALTGSDRQSIRIALLVVVAGLNVALNVLLIPDYGWQGSAVATYVSEVVFIGGLWGSLLYLRRAEREALHD